MVANDYPREIFNNIIMNINSITLRSYIHLRTCILRLKFERNSESRHLGLINILELHLIGATCLSITLEQLSQASL